MDRRLSILLVAAALVGVATLPAPASADHETPSIDCRVRSAQDPGLGLVAAPLTTCVRVSLSAEVRDDGCAVNWTAVIHEADSEDRFSYHWRLSQTWVGDTGGSASVGGGGVSVNETFKGTAEVDPGETFIVEAEIYNDDLPLDLDGSWDRDRYECEIAG